MRCFAALLLIPGALGFVPGSLLATSQIQKAPQRRASPAHMVAAPLEAEQEVVIADCPFTKWGPTDLDVAAMQKETQPTEVFPLEFPKPEGVNTVEEEKVWLAANAEMLIAKRSEYGAVVLRGFELMKDADGFTSFYQLMGLQPCEDPLNSVAARDAVNKKSAVYEAVNKPSRSNYFVGMHNEMVGVRSPASACFVCFKAAEKGGEFLLCDGRRMLKDLELPFLQKLYDNEIKYAVAEFPLGFVDGFPEPLRNAALPVLKGIVDFALTQKVDFEVTTEWAQSDYDQSRVLQARAAPQPPIVRHPITNEPVWFCNVHSHSNTLRMQRADKYGAEKFTSGASSINKSDMFLGDSTPLTEEELAHVAEVTERNTQFVTMTPGDVVMLDNYMTMHGRNVFEGTRKHAVTWFAS